MKLKDYLIDKMIKIPFIDIVNVECDSAIISFNVDDIFAQDVAFYLNKYNICVRAGNHCAKILKNATKVNNTIRVSLYFYNTEKEIDGEIYIKSCDKLYSSVEDVKKSFSDIATTKYIDSLMGKDYIDYDGSLYVKSYSNNIDEKYIEMASYKVVESTSDKISYLVKSRSGELGCSTSCKYEYKEHKFTLVNENNKWKVSEFDMPY